jgi:hypothetical protein
MEENPRSTRREPAFTWIDFGRASSRSEYYWSPSSWVRGLSVQEYLASYVAALGVVSLLAFLLFAAMLRSSSGHGAARHRH